MLFAALATLVSACGEEKEENENTNTPVAPTVITAEPASIQVPEGGGSYEVKLSAPARPKISGTPEWITVKDGTFKDYGMTVTLIVAVNTGDDSRSAALTVSASGASDITISLAQDAKEQPIEPGPGGDDNVNYSIINALGLGWNLGNHFDAFYNGSWAGEKEGYPDENCWGCDSATQDTFDGVRSLGFTAVRIPVSWLKMIGPAPDYTIDETWMNRIAEVVEYAHNAGLAVIINTHHDENHGVGNTYQWLDIKNASLNSETNEKIKTEIAAVWTQIANRFKDCGDWLVMESFNELNDGGWGWSSAFLADPTKQCNILNEWNQVFVDAVRATGGNNATRWLGIPTYAASPSFEKYAVIPSDPAGKIMLAVHCYDPSDYTIGDAQYSDWGHTGAADKKANGGDEDHIKAVFGNLYSKYISKGQPVYLGEFGCSMRAKSDARAWAFYKYYMEYIVKAAKTYGLPCFLWDNGVDGSGKEHHGYINHGTGKPIGNSKEIIDLMKKAWFTESDSYTLETIYNKAPVF